MKKLPFYIMIAFLICNCSTKDKSIEKTWISKYKVFYTELGESSIDYYSFNTILKFTKDSLKINHFKFAIGHTLTDNYSGTYTLNGGKLETSSDTFTIENIYSDSLVLFSNQGAGSQQVFEVLEKYNQASRETEFRKLLTSFTFIDEEDEVIEFRSDGKYIMKNLKLHSPNQLWATYIFENELFLILEDPDGIAIQIQDFDSNQIKGKFHFKYERNKTWNKLDKTNDFETSKLLGNWERIMAPSPSFDPEWEFYNKELLKISNDSIVRFEGYRSDTIIWEPNREKDIFILKHSSSGRRLRLGKQWNIVSIENDVLTLERTMKKGISKKTEISKFKRIR